MIVVNFAVTDSPLAIRARISEGDVNVSHQFSGWMMPMTLLVALVSGLQVSAAGQRPYFETPPPGSGPTPMKAIWSIRRLFGGACGIAPMRDGQGEGV
jgi:hypothetical protein